MENQKNYNEDQAEMAIGLIERNFWIFAIGGTMLGFVIVGAIGSLIRCRHYKKTPDQSF